MKYLFTLLLALGTFFPLVAQQNPIDAISNFFSDYVDDERFTTVYVSGKIFDLIKDNNFEVENMEEDEVEALLKVVRDIQGVRILHTDENTLELYKDAKQRIPTTDYDLLFKVRTKDGQNVEAFMQNDSAAVNELFMLIGADTSFVMLSFVGKIDLSKISELSNQLDN